jgi:hypothetical protein
VLRRDVPSINTCARFALRQSISKRQMLKVTIDKLTESEVTEVLEYIDIMQSLGHLAGRPNRFDEALVWLIYQSAKRPLTKAN